MKTTYGLIDFGQVSSHDQGQHFLDSNFQIVGIITVDQYLDNVRLFQSYGACTEDCTDQFYSCAERTSPNDSHPNLNFQSNILKLTVGFGRRFEMIYVHRVEYVRYRIRIIRVDGSRNFLFEQEGLRRREIGRLPASLSVAIDEGLTDEIFEPPLLQVGHVDHDGCDSLEK